MPCNSVSPAGEENGVSLVQIIRNGILLWHQAGLMQFSGIFQIGEKFNGTDLFNPKIYSFPQTPFLCSSRVVQKF
jgi:hypothetical protein